VAQSGSVHPSPVPGREPGLPLSAGSGAARRAAAAYLRELLLRPSRVRRTWEQYAERNRAGQINQLAVAEVLARHLWNYPRRPGDTDVLPRQLKDTASRALSGKLLSRSALKLFIDAFGLPPFEQDQLWKLWEGSSRVWVLSGPRAFPADAMAQLEAALGPAVHRTLSVHDHHYVGPDRLPNRTRTLQVIEAITDDVEKIPYIYNTNALSIDLIQGCTSIGGRFREVTSGFYAADMRLARKLGLGETLTLEYVTGFKYAEVPESELKGDLCQYRRAVRRRMENIDVRVEFDPQRLPRHVWWAVWDGVAGKVISQEPVELDGQHSAQRFLRFIENTVVGFHWKWLRPP
jgi:hypothetical protein